MLPLAPKVRTRNPHEPDTTLRVLTQSVQTGRCLLSVHCYLFRLSKLLDVIAPLVETWQCLVWESVSAPLRSHVVNAECVLPKKRRTRWAQRQRRGRVFVSERVRADGKETKMKRETERSVSEGHYETNNPSHPEKTAGASWTASQPVDLWQRAEVRLKGESQYNSRGATNTCNITTLLY